MRSEQNFHIRSITQFLCFKSEVTHPVANQCSADCSSKSEAAKSVEPLLGLVQLIILASLLVQYMHMCKKRMRARMRTNTHTTVPTSGLLELDSAAVAFDTPTTVRPIDKATVTCVCDDHALAATRDVALVGNSTLYEADEELGVERHLRVPLASDRHRMDARRIVSESVHMSYYASSKLVARAALHKVVTQRVEDAAIFAREVRYRLSAFRNHYALSSGGTIWRKCDQHSEQQRRTNLKRSTHIENWVDWVV